MQLPLIPSMGKCLEVPIQPLQTAGETPAATHQPCQIVSQLSIIPFNRIGFTLVWQ